MCRLFGMHAGKDPVRATFWLLTAPDSLAQQSRKEADGFGIGTFTPDGRPVVDKAPIAAYEDVQYAQEARELESTTFLAHVRYASTGGDTDVNTHPFEQDNRLLAHNGVVEDLDKLDDRLRQLEMYHLVQGQTDSERVFALITGAARVNGGDVSAAIASTLTWIAQNLRLYAVNIILTTATELWAVRYPDTHPLYVLQQGARGPVGEKRSSRISVHSDQIREENRPEVLVATEKMDANPNWRLLDSGEMLHVDSDLNVLRTFPLPQHPQHLITLADLDPAAAASQHPLKTG
ncbi:MULTISPECIES: class II glutamine amidotransferase [unclassified Arthrobacter]|uniref:class II glutamine amidotransferase n=1 Tax=unclassified Arthrobacter TaxID=235627 RepID=UPI001D13E702|nr:MULTISPECIES: class II glutamine amidotransferase [unclassified Arthrobacter]MCC3292223.1 class II glutamine amidotransferase [Arthrobacter sp. zg-Y1110]MCC3302689.1 class II glutamine amidotransferase [Arthrobacter sp. zg-Y895]UWX85309.1 class II glutamine amidotransferase [Arthrobacter sp. zg-Y1110]